MLDIRRVCWPAPPSPTVLRRPVIWTHHPNHSQLHPLAHNPVHHLNTWRAEPSGSVLVCLGIRKWRGKEVVPTSWWRWESESRLDLDQRGANQSRYGHDRHYGTTETSSSHSKATLKRDWEADISAKQKGGTDRREESPMCRLPGSVLSSHEPHVNQAEGKKTFQGTTHVASSK